MNNRKTNNDPHQPLERLCGLGVLTGGVVHELTNPMNAILMNAELGLLCLQQQSAANEELVDILRTIAAEARRSGELAKELANFSRSDNYAPMAMGNLNDAVNQARRLLSSEPQRRQITLELQLAEHLPDIPLHRMALALATTNLVSLAMDKAASHIQIITTLAESSVVLEINDDGATVAGYNAYPSWIFRLVQQVIADHGGDIANNAEARFRIYLPLAAKTSDLKN